MAEPIARTIDAHVHLWQRSRTPQDWIDPVSMAAIDRDFWLDDLGEVLHANGVGGAVVVQASNSSQETRDLLTAELPAFVSSIVGWVDLDLPGVAIELERLGALHNSSRLKGVRHLAHIDPDPRWLRRPSVSAGLDALEAADLSFDLVVTPEQLLDCSTVASEHPGLTFVLDHLAKPELRSGHLHDWEAGLRALAAFPNVYAKVSGLTMEADWTSWTPQDLRCAMDIALECFGPERLMFGSDWPLVEVCGGYSAWLAAAHELTAELSATERVAVFFGTAAAVYRVED